MKLYATMVPLITLFALALSGSCYAAQHPVHKKTQQGVTQFSQVIGNKHSKRYVECRTIIATYNSKEEIFIGIDRLIDQSTKPPYTVNRQSDKYLYGMEAQRLFSDLQKQYTQQEPTKIPKK